MGRGERRGGGRWEISAGSVVPLTVLPLAMLQHGPPLYHWLQTDGKPWQTREFREAHLPTGSPPATHHSLSAASWLLTDNCSRNLVSRDCNMFMLFQIQPRKKSAG